MSASLYDALEQVVAHYRERGGLALLFDYDGTLAEFTDSPQDADLCPSTHECLQRLAAVPGVTVGIISGRELADLKRRVALEGIFYAGTDGLELEFQGEAVQHPLVWHCSDLVSRVAETLRPFLAACPPAWLEEKRFGLTIHYHGLDAQLASVLLEELERHLAPWGERLHVVIGARAVEITPNVGWTKGTAVQFLLDHLGSGHCCLLYAGDEASDVEAMWAVASHGGIAIGVGSGPPAIADFKLPDVEAVGHLLHELRQSLGADALLPLAADQVKTPPR